MTARHNWLLEGLLWFSAAVVVLGSALLAVELLAEDEPNGVAVVGSLGLILTQTVALIGVLMRKSSEAQAEARLTSEAALKAVELIKPESSGESRPQTDAALLTLMELGQLPTALILVEALWPDGHVSTQAAAHIVERSLEVGTERLQTDAATVLAQNSTRIAPEGTSVHYFPSVLADRGFWERANRDTVYSLLVFFTRFVGHLTVDESTPYQNRTALAGRLNDHMPALVLLAGLDETPVPVADNADGASRNTALHLVESLLPIFLDDSEPQAVETTDGAVLPADMLKRIKVAWDQGTRIGIQIPDGRLEAIRRWAAERYEDLPLR